MSAQPDIQLLSRHILDELMGALRKPPSGLARHIVEPFFSIPARRFARLSANFDAVVAQHGFRNACRWLLPCYASSVTLGGVAHVPADGPLLIAANHPGGPDSVLVGAALPRDDLKIIVNGGEYLRGLPHAGEHFIHTTADTSARMTALRGAIRHLRTRGALLVFASTRVDPDPDVAPGAQAALETWSPSLELMLEKAPETRLLIAVSSGVILKRWVQSPLLRLFQHDPWERQRLAEYFQISQLMLTSSSLNLRPRTTFGRAVTAPELRDLNPGIGLMGNIIQLAGQVLATHMARGAEER